MVWRNIKANNSFQGEINAVLNSVDGGNSIANAMGILNIKQPRIGEAFDLFDKYVGGLLAGVAIKGWSERELVLNGGGNVQVGNPANAAVNYVGIGNILAASDKLNL